MSRVSARRGAATCSTLYPGLPARRPSASTRRPVFESAAETLGCSKGLFSKGKGSRIAEEGTKTGETKGGLSWFAPSFGPFSNTDGHRTAGKTYKDITLASPRDAAVDAEASVPLPSPTLDLAGSSSHSAPSLPSRDRPATPAPPSPPLTDEKAVSPTSSAGRTLGKSGSVGDMLGESLTNGDVHPHHHDEQQGNGTPSSSAALDEDMDRENPSSSDEELELAGLMVASNLQPAHTGAAPPLIRRAMAARLMQTIRFDQRRTNNMPTRGAAQVGKRRRGQNDSADDAESGQGKRKLKRPGKLDIDRDDDELNLDMERLERLKGGHFVAGAGVPVGTPVLTVSRFCCSVPSDDPSGVITPRSITPTTTEIFTEPTTPMLLHSPMNDLTPPGTPAEQLGFSGPLPSEDDILHRIEELRSEKRKVFAMIMARAMDSDSKDAEPRSNSRRTTGDSTTFSLDDSGEPGKPEGGGMPIPTVDSSGDRASLQNTPAGSPRTGSKRPGSPPVSPPYPSKSPRTDGFARPIPGPRNDRPFYQQQYPSHPGVAGGYREDWKPRPSSMTAGFNRAPGVGPYPRPGMAPPGGPGGYQRGPWMPPPTTGSPSPAYLSARRYDGPPGPQYGGGPPPPKPGGSSSLSRGWQPNGGNVGGNSAWSGWKPRSDRDW